MENKQIQRYIGIDILRVIAMLGVVFLHTIYSFTVRTDFFLTKAWFVFEPFAVVSRSSLALFFMISGFLVVSKNRTVRENLKVTFQRIGIPLIAFSILASLFYILKTQQNISLLMSPEYLFKDILLFPNNWLWFLEVLLFLYLLNPLWQGIFGDTSKKTEARYLVFFFFLFTCLSVVLKTATQSLLFFNTFTTWISFVFCYLYGALVRKNWDIRKPKSFYFLVFLVGLIIEIIGNYFSILSQKNGNLPLSVNYFTEYLAIAPLFMSIGMFHIFFDVQKIPRILHSSIQFLAALSYGVYLTHEFISLTVADVLGWGVDTVHANIYLVNGGLFALSFFGAVLITYTISRIPKLRMIIGNTK
ncbi:MAG: acyltransferase family protein [Candidatus Roizmanbacteria bacterium]|nr:acyltransferase family protein [Candidatus Roizmanbacteria bacterium]